jgi:hypothetical protein
MYTTRSISLTFFLLFSNFNLNLNKSQFIIFDFFLVRKKEPSIRERQRKWA